jgi:hypothetical protein
VAACRAGARHPRRACRVHRLRLVTVSLGLVNAVVALWAGLGIGGLS